jgi:2-keto-4-pentenoate hydratase
LRTLDADRKNTRICRSASQFFQEVNKKGGGTNTDKIAKYADELYQSERSCIPAPPITERDETFSLDDAYEVQLRNVNAAVEQGRVISGKKIGLTSRGIQEQLGVNEPDYGHLFADMLCVGGRVDASTLISPKIEAELAFALNRDLAGGNVTALDVVNATEYVLCAFEIVDSRVEDWRIKLPDTVADNASSGRYILGTKKLRLYDLNLADVSMKMYKNGALSGEGKGAAVLGNPCIAVAWLANKLWKYGVTLKAGEIVLSGAFSAAPPAQRDDCFFAEFFDARGMKLDTVEAQFV